MDAISPIFGGIIAATTQLNNNMNGTTPGPLSLINDTKISSSMKQNGTGTWISNVET